MNISLSKDSDVPLRQQLAEQIVFLITTGKLQQGQRMPSVRTLARMVGVHHNTVSEAYQDLVRRSWLKGQRGSSLVVGASAQNAAGSPATLDDLINQSIRRAKEMGYSLAQLTEAVRRRLLAEPPEYFLVVEEELGLQEIICHEIRERFDWPVKRCSPEQLIEKRKLDSTVQIVVPSHIVWDLSSQMSPDRPPICLTFSNVAEHIRQIQALEKPSVVATVSISQSLLKTARGLFAHAIGDRHVLQEFLVRPNDRADVGGVDLAFCDSVVMNFVSCRHKVRYQLIASSCFDDLAATVKPALRE